LHNQTVLFNQGYNVDIAYSGFSSWERERDGESYITCLVILFQLGN